MTHEKQYRILQFWFGEDPLKPLEHQSLWFSKQPQNDEIIRQMFGPMLDEASTGAYDDWVKTPDGALALVVLCDQFSRHIHRDDALAFASDDRALKTAQMAIEQGFDLKYTFVERCFLYLPFEHSEDLAMQERAVELFRELFRATQTEEEGRFVAEALEYAIRHRDVIARFGRFPHRNETLGRETSRVEREFLKRPGAVF